MKTLDLKNLKRMIAVAKKQLPDVGLSDVPYFRGMEDGFKWASKIIREWENEI